MVDRARQLCPGKRSARNRRHRMRHLRSEDVHDLGIKMIFLQNKKEGGKGKRRQKEMLHELCKVGPSGAKGKRGGVGCTQGGGRRLSSRVLSLAGWRAGG